MSLEPRQLIVGVIGAYPHTDALLASPLRLSSGATVAIRSDVTVAGGAGSLYARQAREITGFDFEISELPIVNYLSSRELGAAHVAIPVFLTRRFVHNMLFVDRRVIDEPRDLEGRRVGILYHGHTDSTWVRGILADRYGVDLDRVTWVTAVEEQVEGAPLPGNVVHVPRASLSEMLLNGEVAAQVTNPVHVGEIASGAKIGPMWEDPERESEKWYAETGLFPILHTLVIKRRALDAHPGLAAELFAACESARVSALEAIERVGAIEEADRRRANMSGFPSTAYASSPRAFLGPDPIPYGLAPNRGNVEAIVRMAHAAGVIREVPAVEELFAPVA